MKRGNVVSSVSAKDNVPLADPFILLYEGDIMLMAHMQVMALKYMF